MSNIRRITAAALLAGLTGAPASTSQDKEPTGVFKGHTDAVYSVGQTPDGKVIATASFDRTVRLWDAVTGKQLRNYGGTTGHQSLVLSVAVNPSGELMATGGSDNNLFLWDIPSPKAVREYAHAAPVAAAGVSTDGKTLGGVGKDGSVRLWQAADGKQLQAVPPVRGDGAGGAFTANGQQFVSASSDGFLRWVNTADGKITASIGTSKGALTGFALSPGNAPYTIHDDGKLKFWQAPTGLAKPLPPHADAITQIHLGADGSFLITVGADKVVKSVSTSSGAVGKEFTASAAVSCVAVWPNGSVVAIGQPDGKVILWNRTDGKIVDTLPAHPKKVVAIAAHPTGASFLTVDEEGAANLWAYPIVKPKPPAKDAKEPKDGGDVKPTASFKIPGGAVIGIMYHTTANQILALTADKTVKLFDLSAGKEARTVATLPTVPRAFAVSRDFAILAVALDKTVKLINVADGKEALTIDADATSLSFSADKTKLVTGHADKTARVWDTAKGEFIQAVEHSGPVTGVAFAPTQQGVYVVSSDKTGALLPIQQPKVIQVSPKPLRALAVAPSGSHVIVGGDELIVRAFNTGNGAEEKKFEGSEGPVLAVAVSKNGQTVAVGGADKTIRLFQFAEAKPLATIPAVSVIRALAFHPAGNMVVSLTEDKLLTAWNVTQQSGQPLPDDFGAVVQQWTLPDVGSGVTFNEKGDLFVGLADKTVKQFKIAGTAPVKNVMQHPNLVDAVAFSPDGKYLASGCHDGVLRVFETEKYAAFKVMQAHSMPAPGAAIYSVTWSPDGKQILTTSFDKSMKLWDVAAGTMVKEFKGYADKGNEKGHQDQVFTAIFTKDGKTVISGSSDRRIKKWDVAAGAVTGEFVHPTVKGEPGQSHPGGVYALRLTPDEKFLISAGPAPKNRGYVAVWNMADGKLVSGTETNTGPIYTAILTADGKGVILGCGPKVRQVPEAEALVWPLPAGK